MRQLRMLFITSPGSTRSKPDLESTDWLPQWITRQEEQAYFDDETTGLFFTEWSTKDRFVTGAHPVDHCPVFLHESVRCIITTGRVLMAPASDGNPMESACQRRLADCVL